jgi:hypothetical protein
VKSGLTNATSTTCGSIRPPALAIDQLSVHVDGDAAVVSARTSRLPGSYSRYVDTYERREGGWVRIHACVWPLQTMD